MKKNSITQLLGIATLLLQNCQISDSKSMKMRTQRSNNHTNPLSCLRFPPRWTSPVFKNDEIDSQIHAFIKEEGTRIVQPTPPLRLEKRTNVFNEEMMLDLNKTRKIPNEKSSLNDHFNKKPFSHKNKRPVLENGNTLLMQLVKNGNFPKAKSLLGKEENMNKQNSEGDTLLHLYAQKSLTLSTKKKDLRSKVLIDQISIVIEHGGDCSIENFKGQKPVDLTMGYGEIYCLLRLGSHDFND